MKIAFLLGPWSSSRMFNCYDQNIYISTRGLTGTDLALWSTAECFVKQGHDVSLFTMFIPGTKPDEFRGIKLYYYPQLSDIVDRSFDVVVSINEPDCLRSIPDSCLRICCEYLNDWTFCAPGFENFVDYWTIPSQTLRDHLIEQLPIIANNSCVVPLGCDPTLYTNQKISGRVVSISSADRGLHHFLQVWPQIKRQIPHATLDIYYHLNGDELDSIEPNEPSRHPNVLNVAQRSRYIKYAIKKLANFGVSFKGSASRQQIAEALSGAEVGVCPLDTSVFSEGYSVSSLETMASGTFPIMGAIDALELLWGSVVPQIPAPVGQHLDRLVNLTIKALTDQTYRAQITEQCSQFATNLTWEKCSKQLETVIINHPKFKRPS